MGKHPQPTPNFLATIQTFNMEADMIFHFGPCMVGDEEKSQDRLVI